MVLGGVPVKALSWINFVLGLWLIVAAFALPVRTGPVMAEEAVPGIAVVVLAYASAVGRPRQGISWSVAIAGLWILVVNSGTLTPSKANAMLVGLLVFGLGAANAIYCHHLPRRTGA
jgi:hypothetical protein